MSLTFSSCSNKCWAWEIFPAFVIFLPQNPPFCSALCEVVADVVALYSEAAWKLAFSLRNPMRRSEGWLVTCFHLHCLTAPILFCIFIAASFSAKWCTWKSTLHLTTLGTVLWQQHFFFFNCINLYILNVALGYTASVLGLHVSVFEGLLCSFIVKIDLIRQNLPT